MATELPKSALDLYEAPFKIVRATSQFRYIQDAKGKYIATTNLKTSEHVAQALTEYWNRRSARIEQANHSERHLDMVKVRSLLGRANGNMAQHDIARSLQVEITEFLEDK